MESMPGRRPELGHTLNFIILTLEFTVTLFSSYTPRPQNELIAFAIHRCPICYIMLT